MNSDQNSLFSVFIVKIGGEPYAPPAAHFGTTRGGDPPTGGYGGGRAYVHYNIYTMMTKQQKDDNLLPATLNELIMDMELNPDKYKHLQFIMSRHKNPKMDFGQMYLVVNQVGFGLYRLDNLDYQEGIIILSLTNPLTGNLAEYRLDIYDKHPDVFLINWKDIEDMVYSEIASTYSDNELHELENELPCM